MNAPLEYTRLLWTGQNLAAAALCRAELDALPTDAAERLEPLVRLATALDQVPGEAEALLAAGRELAALAQRVGRVAERAMAAFYLSNAYRRLGLLADAGEQVPQALRWAREIGDPGLQARALLASSQLALEVSDLAEAWRLLEEACALAERSDDPDVRFWTLNNQSHILGLQAAERAAAGQAAEARERCEALLAVVARSLALARDSGRPLHEAFALSNEADAYIVQGDIPAARERVEAYARIARQMGFRRLVAYALLDEARLLRLEGRLDEAIAVLQAPELEASLAGNADVGLVHLTALYELHKASGRFEQALEHHERLMARQTQRLNDRSARLQRVLLARLDLEQAEAAAERARLEARAARLHAESLERERDRHREASLRDPLTGLGNRRAMDEEWAGHEARAARDGELLFAAIIDIDHFKRVNDTYGHARGDAVIVAVARRVLELLRRSDRVYRLGGEELLVLLTDASPQAGWAACERLRRGVAAVPWDEMADGLVVTISLGVTAQQPGDTPAAVLERADAALYEAKRAGRNRCCTG
jgi:diguanylate cyclase (GGDEF)-like protein